MGEKSIVKCVLLTVITCGIYALIWFVTLTDDAAKANDNPNFNGGKALLFTILTCGIYGIYWNYKMGQELYQAKTKRNMQASDQSVLYLILSLIGLGIVNYCLMQNELNEISKA